MLSMEFLPYNTIELDTKTNYKNSFHSCLNEQQYSVNVII